jgi:hypothetical protein
MQDRIGVWPLFAGAWLVTVALLVAAAAAQQRTAALAACRTGTGRNCNSFQKREGHTPMGNPNWLRTDASAKILNPGE